MKSEPTRPQRVGNLAEKDLGDEYIFYNAKAEQVHVLNAVARDIYLLCDGEHSVGDLVREVVNRYEVDEETASRDVDELLQKLIDLRLLSLS